MHPYKNIVILANGRFPSADHCINILQDADHLICCDEAADNLIAFGMEPDIIIGDMDSVSDATRTKYASRLIHLEEQETNDLTKAVNYCVQKGYESITILGATGLREDHALGNISLLLEYNMKIQAVMVSDHGIFSTLKSGDEITSFPGEQLSFFSIDNRVEVSSEGLKYPMNKLQLHNWWRASLNECVADQFVLHFESEWPLIFYRVIE